MKGRGEEIQVRCNISTIVITGVQVKPRNQALHIETIDISYILTKVQQQIFKVMKLDLLTNLGYSATEVSNKMHCV